MDHASSLDRSTPMTSQNHNARPQLNTSLVRSLADTRRDSAVAIASAEVELSAPSNKNSRSTVMPDAHKNPGLGPHDVIGAQQQTGQDASMDTSTIITTTTLDASDKEPKKTKKKKKKATKSSSAGLSTDQPSAQQPSLSTIEDTNQSLSGTAGPPAKQLPSTTGDHRQPVVVDSDIGNHQALTEESLEWLESAVVRGDTKPTGKKPKAKKKSATKKLRDSHTSSTPSSSVKGEAPSESEEDQEREQEDEERQKSHERTSAADSIPTLTTPQPRTPSPSLEESTVLTLKDDLAFLEDDFLGNGGSGNWADEVDEYVCQTAGSTAVSIAVSSTSHSSASNTTVPSSSPYVASIADSGTSTPQGYTSTSAIITPKQPPQAVRRHSGTAEERVDRVPWGHSKKNHYQQQQQPSSTHHHHHKQHDNTGRHGVQEPYRHQPPTRHQEHHKQQQHPGALSSQKSYQRSHIQRSSLTRHHSSKPHEDHPSSHQLGARGERSWSGSKAAGNTGNRQPKQLDSSSQHKQPQAAGTPGEDWDDRDKIVHLLSSRWSAALASVGQEDTDCAVYYSPVD